MGGKSHLHKQKRLERMESIFKFTYEFHPSDVLPGEVDAVNPELAKVYRSLVTTLIHLLADKPEFSNMSAIYQALDTFCRNNE